MDDHRESGTSEGDVTIMESVFHWMGRPKSAPPPPQDRTTMDRLRDREQEAERQRDAELVHLRQCREAFDTRDVKQLKKRIASQKLSALELKKELTG